MDALFARIATNPVGPLICMAVIVAIVLIVKAVLKVQRNPDGYVSVPDDEDEADTKDDNAPDADGMSKTDSADGSKPDTKQ